MKRFLTIRNIRIFLLILIIIGLGFIATEKIWVPKLTDMLTNYEISTHETVYGVNNISYIINGRIVRLLNGKSEIPVVPGSASKITTTLFGAPVLVDLNGDGQNDAVMILTQSGGGSGTFFYVVAAIHEQTKFVSTNAILLGDRIAPQSIQVKNDLIVVNYADRNPGEPMTTKPSLGVSRYFSVQNGILKEFNPGI